MCSRVGMWGMVNLDPVSTKEVSKQVKIESVERVSGISTHLFLSAAHSSRMPTMRAPDRWDDAYAYMDTDTDTDADTAGEG